MIIPLMIMSWDNQLPQCEIIAQLDLKNAKKSCPSSQYFHIIQYILAT